MPNTNTSATGGPLTPTSTLPADGATFDDLLQAIVAGITGIPGNYVRPLWQPEPPEQPPQTVDWCAIGETDSDRQGMPYSQFNVSTNQGSVTEFVWDQVTMNYSCYGPNCFANAKLLRDSFYIAQNREALIANGIGFVEGTKVVRVPEIISTVWRDRADGSLVFNRVQTRTYNILAILSSMPTILANAGSLVVTA